MKKIKNIQEVLPYEYEAKRLYKLSYEDFAKMINPSCPHCEEEK